MKRFWKRHGFVIITALALTLFTGYALLDTFVLPKSYAKVEQQAEEIAEIESFEIDRSEIESTENRSNNGEILPQITENSYRDSHVSIELSQYRVNQTTVYVADIVLEDASGLKTAMANDTYGKNIKADTSEIAAAHQAILAINGDFYGARNAGYVIREGVLYRSSSAGNEDLVIYQDGSFEIIREGEISAEELLERGAWNVLSFGPALVKDGEITVSAGQEVGKAMASNPRTAIGRIEEGHYLMVVSDGRTKESEGLSLLELAQFLETLGVQTAYNLDGGGSSTMIFQGNLINNPTTGGKHISERSVSDIVYVGY